MAWDTIWREFIQSNHIEEKARQLAEIESYLGRSGPDTKKICEAIYYGYDELLNKLQEVDKGIKDEIKGISNVCIRTSRIKTRESVLKKIITKRFLQIGDDNSLYTKIGSLSLENVMTDLVGIRIIVNDIRQWELFHFGLLKTFPFDRESISGAEHHLLPHTGNSFMAEIPKAYYAPGDDISYYDDLDLECILRENGYRSIHYTVNYKGYYVEIQVRTIYDEAWSNCDHDYVYKHEDNVSYDALSAMSKILGDITRTCEDYSKLMGDVFKGKSIVSDGDGYKTSQEVKDEISSLENRIKEVNNKLNHFIEKISVRENEGDS